MGPRGSGDKGEAGWRGTDCSSKVRSLSFRHLPVRNMLQKTTSMITPNMPSMAIMVATGCTQGMIGLGPGFGAAAAAVVAAVPPGPPVPLEAARGAVVPDPAVVMFMVVEEAGSGAVEVPLRQALAELIRAAVVFSGALVELVAAELAAVLADVLWAVEAVVEVLVDVLWVMEAVVVIEEVMLGVLLDVGRIVE